MRPAHDRLLSEDDPGRSVHGDRRHDVDDHRDHDDATPVDDDATDDEPTADDDTAPSDYDDPTYDDDDAPADRPAPHGGICPSEMWSELSRASDVIRRIEQRLGFLDDNVRVRLRGSYGFCFIEDSYVTGWVEATAEARGELVQLCAIQTWSATVEARIATSVPVFWNGEVMPFEDGRLTGERNKSLRSFFTNRFTEKVTYTECSHAGSLRVGPWPDTVGLFVFGPNPVVSLNYSLTVRAELRDGTVVETKVPRLVKVSAGPFTMEAGFRVKNFRSRSLPSR